MPKKAPKTPNAAPVLTLREDPADRDKLTRANGRATRVAVREAAIELFHQHGYKNVSLRTLAGVVGVQAGSLYNHISTKQELLFILLKEIMEDLLNDTRERLARGRGPLQQLHEFVETHLEFHTLRLREISIGNSELRNLDPENYEIIVALRREYFNILHDVITEGVEQRMFVVSDSRVVARVIMGMLNGVSGWYHRDGPVTQKALIDIYLKMIFRALGAPLAISEHPVESAPAIPAKPRPAAKRAAKTS